jgi:hypothetical protein
MTGCLKSLIPLAKRHEDAMPQRKIETSILRDQVFTDSLKATLVVMLGDWIWLT